MKIVYILLFLNKKLKILLKNAWKENFFSFNAETEGPLEIWLWWRLKYDKGIIIGKMIQNTTQIMCIYIMSRHKVYKKIGSIS